jgi:deoxyribodipyrimidine photo-lyase
MLCFILTPSFPEATSRHYTFMLEGLCELSQLCKEQGLPFYIYNGEPFDVVTKLTRHAACLITDRGYLRIQRDWRKRIAGVLDCAMIEVETDAVVPIETVSDHEEYAARTIRPKINRLLDQFLTDSPRPELHDKKLDAKIPRAVDISASRIDDLIQIMPFPKYPAEVVNMKGGTSIAKEKLNSFILHKLAKYAEDRNKPFLDATSGLSPYLHFGQISPVYMANQILLSKVDLNSKSVFLEELIVRRELSLNFCWYNQSYDTFDCLPTWARATLMEHSGDHRTITYSYEKLENADTHDPYWNAAQQEMVNTGIMHNYMRMYWGKKILEWIPDPINAYEFALYMNNKYQLDGRDPNSYAGVAWCFGKHDRPWSTRPIFGTVRSMTSAGLERKFDMPAYILKH